MFDNDGIGLSDDGEATSLRKLVSSTRSKPRPARVDWLVMPLYDVLVPAPPSVTMFPGLDRPWPSSRHCVSCAEFRPPNDMPYVGVDSCDQRADVARI